MTELEQTTAVKSPRSRSTPEGVARLGVSHLHRRRLYGDQTNAGFGAHRRTANARNLREGKAAQSAFKNPWRWQRTLTRKKLRMLRRKASSTLAPPSGRAPATGTRLLTTGSELGGSVWRFLTRRVAVAYLKRTPQISLAGRSILPCSGKRFREAGQVLSHHPTFLWYRNGGRFF